MSISPNIAHQDLTYQIIGCAMRIHGRVKPGLPEKHFQRALTAEIIESGLALQEEYFVEVYDKNSLWLGRLYLDHFVSGLIPQEDKAVTRPMNNKDMAQVIGQFAATGTLVGLLINFGRPRLEFHRILRPETLQDWQQYARPYLWRPPGTTAPPGHEAKVPARGEPQSVSSVVIRC